MPVKDSSITITDQFCGAGGSSLGAERAIKKHGGHVKLALSHWELAIETHNTNFPETLHDCTDVSACDPRRYPSTNILLTSPECTRHSLAQGKKVVKAQMDMFDKGVKDPSAERSRATMWDVCRFAEFHDYELIITENVVDVRKWVMWDAWILAMHSLGYNHKCCYFNSMFFEPTPQSRDRIYVVFWKKGNKAPDLEFMPKAFCPKCEKDIEARQSWKKPEKKYGKYKTQYIYTCPSCTTQVHPYYYAAFNIIDWSDVGTRIGDRKKPLSPNTIKRIQYGLDKYASNPFQVLNYSPGNTMPMSAPTNTVTTKDHHGVCMPFVINDQHSTGVGFRVKGADDHLPTIPGTHQMKLVTPFIIKGEHTLQSKGYVVHGRESLLTQTGRQSMGLCVLPQIVEMNRTGKARGSEEALSTVLANGNHHGLLTPFFTINRGKSKTMRSTDPITTQSQIHTNGIVTSEAWNSFMGYYYNGSDVTSHITDPTMTMTGKDRAYMINYKEPGIDDCYYRMIKPHEVQRAMAFPDEYLILGNSREKVKQCGNAVTPPVMEWLVGRVVDSLN